MNKILIGSILIAMIISLTACREKNTIENSEISDDFENIDVFISGNKEDSIENGKQELEITGENDQTRHELEFAEEEIIDVLNLDFTDRREDLLIKINEDGTEISIISDSISENKDKFIIEGVEGTVKSVRYISEQLIYAGSLYILNTDGELFIAESDIDINTDEVKPNKFVAREVNLNKKANAISIAGIRQNKLIIKYEDGTFSDSEWIKKEIVDSLLLGNYKMSGIKIQEKECELKDVFENIVNISEFSIGSNENDNIGSVYIAGIDSQGRSYKYNCYEGLSVDYKEDRITGDFNWGDYYSDKKYEGDFDEINYIEYEIEPITNNVTLKIVFKEDSKEIDFEKKTNK